jgi:hypothetical protein
MPRRGDTFVHLSQVDIGPWDLVLGQIAEHDPRGMSAADGHDKAPARCHSCLRVGGDDVGGLARHLVCICKYFNLHENINDLGLSLDDRVLPSSGRRDSLIDLAWPPGVRIVFKDGSPLLEHRVDDSPSLFDVIFPGKEGRVSGHGVS